MSKILHSVQETQKVARDLAIDIKGGVYPHKRAMVLALVGDLGAGKTTFVKAFLGAFGVRRKITSPTFLIMRKYPPNIYHIDCYRIKILEELMVLGFREILNNLGNLVLIEWADKIKNLIPEDAIWIKLGHGETESERVMEISV